MTETVNIYEAKTQLSQLVDRAAAGEDVIIARNGKPVARLTKLVEKRPVQFGWMKGEIEIADDFDAPMPPAWLDQFYNGPIFPDEKP
jgi:prevent-host-death family protein